MINVVLREASMLDESKYVDIFPVIYKEKKYYIRIELLKPYRTTKTWNGRYINASI